MPAKTRLETDQTDMREGGTQYYSKQGLLSLIPYSIKNVHSKHKVSNNIGGFTESQQKNRRIAFLSEVK